MIRNEQSEIHVEAARIQQEIKDTWAQEPRIWFLNTHYGWQG